MRAGVVGAQLRAHLAGAIDHGGRHRVAIGGAGGNAVRGDLAGEVQRHVFLAAHGLGVGGAGDDGGGEQGEGLACMAGLSRVG